MPEHELKLNDNLEEAIIRVVAFFDLFSRPLTIFEIRDNLDMEISLSEIEEKISRRPEIINQKNGFYFLAGREEIVAIRQKRHNYSLCKIKIAARFSRLFKFCPFVKMIAMANSIGAFNLRAESDIDFFIITSSGRIWLSRLFCAGLAKILNVRPTAEDKKNKICLSFYIAENHLNLDDLKLIGGDPYFEHWQRGLVVLYNKKGTFERFQAANGLRREPAPAGHNRSEFGRTESAAKWLDRLEKIARNWQLKIMPPALRNSMNKSGGAVISNEVLKLYFPDRRQEFLSKYQYEVNKILQKNR